jgi:hypothetical protein
MYLSIGSFLNVLKIFGFDPDSIRSVDPDPDSKYGSRSRSRRAKITYRNRKSSEISCIEVLDDRF